MAFFAEYGAIPPTSTHFVTMQRVNEVVEFLFNEMVGSGRALEELAESGEEWLNSDKNSVYFELESNAGYSCNVSCVCVHVQGGASAAVAVSATWVWHLRDCACARVGLWREGRCVC